MARMDKTLTELKAELAQIQAKIDAMRQLQMTRVANRNMFKREKLENTIKGK